MPSALGPGAPGSGPVGSVASRGPFVQRKESVRTGSGRRGLGWGEGCACHCGAGYGEGAAAAAGSPPDPGRSEVDGAARRGW